jgi:hypothetical protein
MEYPMHEQTSLASVSFTISGDHVTPEFWTGYFGIAPTIVGVKGEPIRGPGGQGTAGRRTGVWGIESSPAVASDELEPHLRYLMRRLQLPRNDLRTLLKQSGAKMRFLCYWVNETGDRVPDVPPDILATMNDMAGTIEIDEYR